MAHGNVTEEELAELVRRTEEAASALIRGDIRAYITLLPHADDFTLMGPFGGEPTRVASTHRARAWKPWSASFRVARRSWNCWIRTFRETLLCWW
jgi:hypothetical protein